MDQRITEWSIIDGNLRRLEKVQSQKAGAAQNWDNYQFLVSPTCPPSTSVIVRGGRYQFAASAGSYSRRIEASTFDFVTDTDDVYSYWPYTCVNANWYVPVYMGLCWYGEDDRYEDGWTERVLHAIL